MSTTKLLLKNSVETILDTITRHPIIIKDSNGNMFVRVFSSNSFVTVSKELSKLNILIREQVMMTHWQWYKVDGTYLVEENN